jgi:hypothetical protein
LIALRIRVMYSAVRRFHSRGIRQSPVCLVVALPRPIATAIPIPANVRAPGNVDRNVSEPGLPIDHLVGADEERGQHEAKALTCQVSSWISLTMDVIVQKNAVCPLFCYRPHTGRSPTRVEKPRLKLATAARPRIVG